MDSVIESSPVDTNDTIWASVKNLFLQIGAILLFMLVCMVDGWVKFKDEERQFQYEEAKKTVSELQRTHAQLQRTHVKLQKTFDRLTDRKRILQKENRNLRRKQPVVKASSFQVPTSNNGSLITVG